MNHVPFWLNNKTTIWRWNKRQRTTCQLRYTAEESRFVHLPSFNQQERCQKQNEDTPTSAWHCTRFFLKLLLHIPRRSFYHELQTAWLFRRLLSTGSLSHFFCLHFISECNKRVDRCAGFMPIFSASHPSWLRTVAGVNAINEAQNANAAGAHEASREQGSGLHISIR